MSLARPLLPAGYRLVPLDEVVSTNDVAKRLARGGAAETTVVWALAQTAGRGRRGRAWSSPRGNLYVSLVLRPQTAPDRAAQLGFAAALAVTDAIGELAPELDRLACKWPNDVLARGRKVAGILLESEMGTGHRLAFLILGVGINLASAPLETEFPATSIADEGCLAPAPATALAAFLGHFAGWAERWRVEGFAPLREAWRARAAGLGRPIAVRLDRGTLDGKFIDIDDHGALLLETAGATRSISVGDVFPVR